MENLPLTIGFIIIIDLALSIRNYRQIRQYEREYLKDEIDKAKEWRKRSEEMFRIISFFENKPPVFEHLPTVPYTDTFPEGHRVRMDEVYDRRGRNYDRLRPNQQRFYDAVVKVCNEDAEIKEFVTTRFSGKTEALIAINRYFDEQPCFKRKASPLS